MKTLISIIGAIALSSSGISIFANTTAKSMKTQKECSQEVDWDYIQKLSNNLFANISIENNSSIFLNENSIVKKGNLKMQDVINYAQKETNKIVKKLSTKNFNLDEIINFVKEYNADFGKEYDFQNNKSSSLKNFHHDNILLLKKEKISKIFSKNLNSLFSINEKKETKELLKKLYLAKGIFTAGTAAAAIAAAGFYAAAWWFGISIPWAVGCTIASTTLATASSALSIALIRYDENIRKWEKGISAFSSTLQIASILRTVAISVLYIAQGTLTTLTWCFPAAIGILAVIGTTIVWIKYNNL